MRSKIFVHQKNSLSFSYERFKITKSNFQTYLKKKHSEYIQQDPSIYLQVSKNGIYQFSYQDIQTYCRLSDLKRCFYQSDDVYFFLLKYLQLNFFDPCDQMKRVSQKLEYISSTFHPEDILEVNQDDYYKVFIKNQHRPLYLQTSVGLYNESGHQKKLLDLVHQLGPRRVLGLNESHHPEVFCIERVQNVTPDDDELSFMDPPFFEIGLNQERLPVLMDKILVDLN